MSQQFIPGIYNYCDRWCERCAFTSRCRNFEGSLTEKADSNNEAFWNSIAGNFAKTKELLYKAAAERGIDLDTVLSEEEKTAHIKKEADLDKKIGQHPVVLLCKQYEGIVLAFFESEFGKALVDKNQEMVSQLHMGIQTEDKAANIMADYKDCEEIIQWYVFFIEVKLQRALHGLQDETGDDDGYPKDSDGSAKVALAAIDRSIAAWLLLYQLLPACEDNALQALALLSRIKNRALEIFPNALQFKRPGFDE
jgi:hypothetical protein